MEAMKTQEFKPQPEQPREKGRNQPTAAEQLNALLERGRGRLVSAQIQQFKKLFEKTSGHLASAAKFTLNARRILVFALTVALAGIVMGPFIGFPQAQLRWAAFFLIAAEVAVEIRWKCLSTYFLGAARAGWMERRSFLVDGCGQLTTCTNLLQALPMGKTGSWVTPVRETANSVSGHVQSILAGVNDLDHNFRGLEDLIGTGPFLPVGCSEAVMRLPKIWERFSSILPRRLRREAFDPAFNDMLEGYMRAQKFLGKSGRRWLAFGFTARAILIVLDCIRVMLTSGVARLLVGALPESFRAWWRRQ